MPSANRFEKRQFTKYGWYTCLDKYSKSEQDKVLNTSLRFIKDKNDIKKNVLVCFQFEVDDDDEMEYDNLSNCCKEAVDDGCRYCPECGEYVENVKHYSNIDNVYCSLEDSNVWTDYPQNEEDFKKVYLDYSYADDDFFDNHEIYSQIYMNSDLLEKVEQFLEGKK